MADQGKKPADAGTISRLAGRGEDALTKVMDELGKNSLLTEALARAMSAKGRVDETTRKTLGQVGLAASGEIRELRTRLDKLEQRVASLERDGGTASRAGRKPATSTKASGGTAKKTPAARSGSTSGSRPRSSSSGSSRSGSSGSSGSPGSPGS